MATREVGTPGWSDAEEAIMQATYRALLEHGYADLSVSRIAAELGKSKGSLYYHYDSKENLMAAFLEYATDRFLETVEAGPTGSARAELDKLVGKLLPLRPDDQRRHAQAVVIGLRGQAVTSERFREQFTAIDERLAATIRAVIERGIDRGEFRDVEAARVAEHVLATVNGAMFARTTTDRDAAAAVRVSLSAYLDAELHGGRGE